MHKAAIKLTAVLLCAAAFLFGCSEVKSPSTDETETNSTEYIPQTEAVTEAERQRE